MVSAITFSAVLSVVVVLYLPLLIPLFDLAGREYGILAGLQAVQIGTTVKLIRVLMLGAHSGGYVGACGTVQHDANGRRSRAVHVSHP